MPGFLFLKLKDKRAFKYIIFKTNHITSWIIVARKAKLSRDASYERFWANLPANECRFAVYDFNYKKADSSSGNRIFFFVWSPEEASMTVFKHPPPSL